MIYTNNIEFLCARGNEMYNRKPLNEMTLKDDFMFSAVMMNTAVAGKCP